MMILKGVLGLLQCVFLPGLLWQKCFKLHGGLLERLLYLLPLSLSANYLLVWTACGLRIYSAPFLYTVIFAECVALGYVYRYVLGATLNATGQRIRSAFTRELEPLRDSKRALLYQTLWLVIGCAALSAVLWSVHLCRLRFGKVFSAWDTLFSWNVYAERWASGHLPVIEGLYPQLLPANWSISYVLLGNTEIQLFNTLLPPLFFLWIMLMLFDLGFQRRECGWFIAAVICRYMMKKLMGDGLFDGYMDVPATCMILLTVYTLIKKQNVLLALIFACAAAVTKQVGLVVLGLFPLLVYLWQPDAFRSLSRKERVLAVCIPLLIVLPWYAFAWFKGESGTAAGITRFNQQYELSHKIYLARQTLGIYIIPLLFSLPALLLLKREERVSFFLLSWPIVIVWALRFSYDGRNVCAALPFIACICGLALDRLSLLIIRGLEKNGCGKVPVALLLLLLLLFGVAVALLHLFPDERIASVQKIEQRNLFGARLNRELLYGFLGEEHEGNDILTDYPAYYLSGYRECCSMIDFTNSEHFHSAVSDPKMRWLLIPRDMPAGAEGTFTELSALRKEGLVKEIGCSDGYYIPYCLYEINHL